MHQRKVMGISSSNCLIFVLVLFAFSEMQMITGKDTLSCTFRSSPCFGKQIQCPSECPLKSPSDPKAKVCFLDCTSPVCKTQCRRKISLFSVRQFRVRTQDMFSFNYYYFFHFHL